MGQLTRWWWVEECLAFQAAESGGHGESARLTIATNLRAQQLFVHRCNHGHRDRNGDQEPDTERNESRDSQSEGEQHRQEDRNQKTVYHSTAGIHGIPDAVVSIDDQRNREEPGEREINHDRQSKQTQNARKDEVNPSWQESGSSR